MPRKLRRVRVLRKHSVTLESSGSQYRAVPSVFTITTIKDPRGRKRCSFPRQPSKVFKSNDSENFSNTFSQITFTEFNNLCNLAGNQDGSCSFTGCSGEHSCGTRERSSTIGSRGFLAR